MTCGALKESYGDTRQHGIVTFSNLRTATIVIEHLSHASQQQLSCARCHGRVCAGCPLAVVHSLRRIRLVRQARQVVHDSHVLGMELVVR